MTRDFRKLTVLEPFLKFHTSLAVRRIDETHLPAKQCISQTNPRVSQANVHKERTKGNQCSSSSSTQENSRIEKPSGFSFSRRFRLIRKREIDHVFRQASFRSAQGPLLVLGVPNCCEHPRLGVAIQKRYARRATQRNAIKRQIREWFRHNQDTISNMDFVITLRYSISDPKVVPVLLDQIAVKLTLAK